jgi:hypothetical protein
VLENLLHMAAHGLAAARGISDTSRRGQYHNKKDRELARSVRRSRISVIRTAF